MCNIETLYSLTKRQACCTLMCFSRLLGLIMKRILTILIFLTVCSLARAQKQDCSVVLNHFLIVVDSTTYQAILNSEILNTDFAYSYEKKLKGYSGIYIIGQDNYIEIFHPKSVDDEIITVGFSWVCQSSLVANCMEKHVLPDDKHIKYSSDENFDNLSVSTQDSVYIQASSGLMTTREMNQNLYEGWTKKTYNDSLNFQTTDYNSTAESDSSKNYLFNNVTGIQIKMNLRDSLRITQYLNLIGYTVESKVQNKLKFSNSIDFIELDFSENVEFASISVIYFKLNQLTELKHISIGNTEIVTEDNTGKWELKTKPNNK